MERNVARKRFGQHFLVDRFIVDRLIDAIDPRPGDCLVEIGPGRGALTRPLLSRIRHLRAVEIDRDIVARLKREFPPEALSIHEGDALDVDFGAFGAKIRLVGNLPYNISTPLLFHLEKFADKVIDMTFMLQKEVVDRLVARPGTADYGRLTVMLGYRFDQNRLFDVPPESFDPPPRVDSSVVRLVPRQAAPTVRDFACFSRLVQAAFAQRRKMLRNNLKGLLDESDFRSLRLSPTARAEELSIDDYVRIGNRAASTK